MIDKRDDLIAALRAVVKAQTDLLSAYRLNDRRRAGKAIDTLMDAKEALKKLEGTLS